MCVNAAFIRHYVEGAPSIKACRRCYLASTRALDLVRYAYPNAGAFLTTDSRKAVEATEVVAIGKGEHGSIFVMRNPPQGTRDQHQDVDWSQFPAASEDVYLQVNCFVASDDSNQSAYHTRAA